MTAVTPSGTPLIVSSLCNFFVVNPAVRTHCLFLPRVCLFCVVPWLSRCLLRFANRCMAVCDLYACAFYCCTRMCSICVVSSLTYVSLRFANARLIAGDQYALAFGLLHPCVPVVRDILTILRHRCAPHSAGFWAPFITWAPIITDTTIVQYLHYLIRTRGVFCLLGHPQFCHHEYN